jgi:cytochrome b involved in lipid metabolism
VVSEVVRSVDLYFAVPFFGRGLVGPPKPAIVHRRDEPKPSDDIVPVMSTTPYTLAEIAKHNTDKDCWVIIDGKVYDSTEWLKDHPGGKAIIMGIAGQDATKQFDALHSKRTKKKLLKGKFATQVGVLASARL